MGFTKLGLSDRIIEGVQAAGYESPTPIQSLAIKPAAEGRDIIGRAQTGTGKTAAFVLPMLHRLHHGDITHAHPRALVLTPTRELAQQVMASVRTYGSSLHLRTVCLYGGTGMDGQTKRLQSGVDIIVATPGRLLDHMQRGAADLSHISVLVLDEADRMLDMGFIQDVRKIIAATPADRQTMLFSATLSDDINELASSILRDPEVVDAGEPHTPVQTVTQQFYGVASAAKTSLLLYLLKKEGLESVLVFTRTKHGADKITRRLDKAGIQSASIHSNRSQSQRERALEGFKDGKFRVLVATDIAARGLDVDGISHVINYDIPHHAEDYLHRIGRTGRAGATGDAMTFVAPEEKHHVRRIEQFIGTQCSVVPCPGFIPPPRTEESERSPGRPHGQRPVIDPLRHGKVYRPEAPGRRSTGGRPDPQRNPLHKRGKKKGKKKWPGFAKKKNPLQKLQSYSSYYGGGA